MWISGYELRWIINMESRWTCRKTPNIINHFLLKAFTAAKINMAKMMSQQKNKSIL